MIYCTALGRVSSAVTALAHSRNQAAGIGMHCPPLQQLGDQAELADPVADQQQAERTRWRSSMR